MKYEKLLCTLPLLAAVGCTAKAAKTEVQKPNVVFILTDDMGEGLLSCYGQKHFSTPNIDRIINNSVQYDNAYSSSYSGPARMCLLTGYQDLRNDTYKVIRPSAFCTLDTTKIAISEDSINTVTPTYGPDDLHMAQMFKEAGYETYAVGKLEWGFISTRKQMSDRGWDHYYGYLDHQRCHGFHPPFLFEDGKIVMIEGNTHADAAKTPPTDCPEDRAIRWNMEGKAQYSEHLFMDKITTFLRKKHDKPFFLYYPTQLPHGPISIHKEDIDPEIANNPHLTTFEKEYAAMMKLFDKSVGTILDELEAQGLMENTMVVFMADNGHAPHYYIQEGRTNPDVDVVTGEKFDSKYNKYNSVKGGDVFDGSRGTSGYKRNNLDGGLKVPLAFYWKGHIEPRISNQLVAGYDILPTFAQMVGVDLKVKKSGTSFLDELLNGTPLPSSKYVVTDSVIDGPMIVTNDGWKYRYYPKESSFELYNLRQDPRELTDVLSENPELGQRLDSTLKVEAEHYWAKAKMWK